MLGYASEYLISHLYNKEIKIYSSRVSREPNEFIHVKYMTYKALNKCKHMLISEMNKALYIL
jgi:hypothetical protein